MRADRLVSILLLLQARGRLTAGQLAVELEVSVKTARRDLDALAAAGVPVYAQPGRGGGWSLLGGARTDLSGLTAGEARALFLVAGPAAPLASDARSALRKLVRALPETFRTEAERAASAVVLDPASWGETRDRSDAGDEHRDALQRAIVEERQVRLGYVDRRHAETERVVHPLGLVRKARDWYLVGSTEAGLRTFRLSRIQSVVLLDDRAIRPAGFDLQAAWREAADAVERRRAAVHARIHVDDRALAPLQAHFGTALRVLGPVADGVVAAEVSGPAAVMIAEQLAGWGSLVEVVAPDEVRAHLAEIGRRLVERYAPSGGSAPARRPA